MPTPYTIRPGQVLTDYSNVRITVERVASGGMGLVAMGPNTLPGSASVGEWFALKTVRPELLATDPTLSERFLREALTWQGVWPHPNILTAQAVTQIDGLIFLILHYAEHGSLADLLAQGRLPLPTALLVAQQITAGLVALHTPDPAHLRPQPLVHRDLKPANVLIRQIGQGQYVQITDFGLVALLPTVAGGLDADQPVDPTRSARFHTQAGSTLGTPAYMAPEQWQDLTLAGPPADLYALGLLLAELVTGQHPLLGLRTRHAVGAWRQVHLGGTPQGLQARVPEVPVPLERLYQGLVAKRAEDRPTAGEALAGLQAVAQRLGTEAYVPPEVWVPTPDHEAIFWMNWAEGYRRFKRYAEALERIEAALRLSPDHPDVLLNQGNILRYLQRVPEAMAAYERALARLPADDHRGRKVVHNNLGLLYCEQGAYALAEAAYGAALEEMPEAATTWYNRACNELEWGMAERVAGRGRAGREHLEQARAFAQRALQLNPQATNTPGLLALIERVLEE